MPETTPKKVDKLDRQDYIKFTEKLILNSNNYKRDNDSKSYVMALDSAWGTGKSYFIDLLIQDVQEQGNIFVVKYNAWANDYCDNAFNPLIYDILKSDALIFDTDNEADIINIKKIILSIGKIGLAIGKQILNKKICEDYGIELDEAINQAITSGEHIKKFMFRVSENLEQLNEQRKSFEELKVCLSSATKWMQKEGKKLVVIIDELDRCKPTFAIQTLEIVKHLFDVENIVFLFAVDIEQLSQSVSTIYGQDFDSVGYLCRFFDYISKLPNPKMEKYIFNKFEEVDFNNCDSEKITLCNFFGDLVQRFNLSLRDIDTVIQSYKILNNTQLHKYSIIGAHCVYLFYLTLKYKKPDVYNEIFAKKTVQKNVVTQLEKDFCFDGTEGVYINDSIRSLDNNEQLMTRSMALYELGRLSYRAFRIKKIQNNSILSYNDFSTIRMDDISIWGNILFYPDLKNWDEICTYTYREYIHKQLENYNFIDLEAKKAE